MKKRNFLIIVLSLIIIILSISLIKINNNDAYIQTYIDDIFKSNLMHTSNGFNRKYNEMSIVAIDENYSVATKGIEVATEIINLTSYKENDALGETVLALRNYINMNSPIKGKVDYDVNSKIFRLINEMSLDLRNEEKCIELKNYIINSKRANQLTNINK